MTNIKLVILDLDGTIYRKPLMPWYMLLHLIGQWHKLFRERRARKMLKGQFFGAEFYTRLYKAMGFDGAEKWYWNVYMPAMIDVIKQHYHAAQWLIPFIEQMRKNGARIVVLSDYELVEPKLNALHISPLIFDAIYDAPSLGGLKPAKQLGLNLLEQYGTQPEETLVIGDRKDTDAALALAIGATYMKPPIKRI